MTADDTSFFTSASASSAFSSTKTKTSDEPVNLSGPPASKGKEKAIAKKPKASQPPQQSKSRQTLKFKIRFDSHQMLFDDTFPPELQPVMPREEWEGLMRHLNTDLNQEVQESITDLHSWTTGMLSSSAVVVGVFVVPVVWWKKHKHLHHMEEFWKQVKQYFSDINKKTFIRRGLEWKVVEERRKQSKRDCYNPVYLMRAELLWRQNVVKSKKEMARIAGATAGSTVKQEKRSSKRKSASRPPSNIGSVKEVSPEREVDDPVGTVGAVDNEKPEEALEEPEMPETAQVSSESDTATPSRPVSGIVTDTASTSDNNNKPAASEATEAAGLFLSDSE